MGVFNIAANTWKLPGVAEPYYAGKKARADIESLELANEYMPAEQDRAERELAVDEGNLELRQKEHELEVQKDIMARLEGETDDTREAILRYALAAQDVFDEGGSPEEADMAGRIGFGYGAEKVFGPDQTPADPFSVRAILAGNKELVQGKGVQAKFIGADGKAYQGYFYNNRYYDAAGRLHEDATPIAPAATQEDINGMKGGATESDISGRTARDIIGSTNNIISEIDRVVQQVNDYGQESLGAPGFATAMISRAYSAGQGFLEIAQKSYGEYNNNGERVGAYIEETGEEVSDEDLLNPELYEDIFKSSRRGFFSRASAEQAALEANSIAIAYALARGANPDGRISDADVRHQLDRLQLHQSDKARIRAAAAEVRRSQLQSAINWIEALGAAETKDGKAAIKDYRNQLRNMGFASSSDAPRDTVTYEDGTTVEFYP